MTRNELAQQVVAKGIKTEKSPFFMSSAQLEVLLMQSPKLEKGEKQRIITSMIKAGKTRVEILTELKAQGIITTVGYINNIALVLKLKITSIRK